MRDKIGQELIGKIIQEIWINQEFLTFNTDKGLVTYAVEGDCCSNSYFHDFYGVQNLLSGNPVVAFEGINLMPVDPEYRPETWEQGVIIVEDEVIIVYGYKITTECPKFGLVTSVFSFRNSSNGYYGGEIYSQEGRILKYQRQVMADVIEVINA